MGDPELLRYCHQEQDNNEVTLSEKQIETKKNSGEIRSDDPVVELLYILMRDHLPTGDVVGLVRSCGAQSGERSYTNGWQAQHAIELAKELRGE